MDNDALVAALGSDAVAAVNGYRSRVVLEAGRRGVRLVSVPFPGPGRDSTGTHVTDPIDVHLRVVHSPGFPSLTGRTLHWSPARGWSMSHHTASAPLNHFAGPGAAAILLVPPVLAVVDWALGDLHGRGGPPVDVELDDDPVAIYRLRGFVEAPTPPQEFASASPAGPPNAPEYPHGPRQVHASRSDRR